MIVVGVIAIGGLLQPVEDDPQDVLAVQGFDRLGDRLAGGLAENGNSYAIKLKNLNVMSGYPDINLSKSFFQNLFVFFQKVTSIF